MGIPTGDNDVVYGNDCLNGWPAGLTPVNIGLRFIGILQGDLWAPADGAPQNFEFVITQSGVAPCEFRIVIGALTYFVIFGAATTTAGIAGYGWGLGFSGVAAGVPKVYIPNDRIVPAGNHFYSGHAELGILPGTALPTIHGMQDLINIEHSSKTFVSVFGADADEAVYRVGRRFDATNLLIKTLEP